MQNLLDNVQKWLSEYSVRGDIFWLIAVLIVSFILHKVLKKILSGTVKKILSRITAKTKSKLDDYIFDKIHVERVSLIIYIFAFNFLSLKLSFGAGLMQKIASLISRWIIIRRLHGLLDGLTA